MQVNFDDAGLAQRCNSAERGWDGAAQDVSLALGLLAACDSVEAYLALPTTRFEEEIIVFEGTNNDVRFHATAEPGTITIHQVIVTGQA